MLTILEEQYKQRFISNLFHFFLTFCVVTYSTLFEKFLELLQHKNGLIKRINTKMRNTHKKNKHKNDHSLGKNIVRSNGRSYFRHDSL